MLLSKNERLSNLLSSSVEKNATLKSRAQFDEYVKSMLYSQGYSSLWLMGQSGEVRYTSNPEGTTVPSELLRPELQNPPLISVLLGEKEPLPFYFRLRLTDEKGNLSGTLFLEVPREFLSVELHNTISMDSLTSYLVSSQGTLDQLGKVRSDTCSACQWSDSRFIRFSPNKKIGETWKLFSVYPTSQINIQHITYTSFLDGMIAFFIATGVAMVFIYFIQTIQKSKGITHADIMLVQTTWNAVSEYSIKIIDGFYKYLFADAPEVKPMFKSAKAEQEQRMALMINTIVNSADSLEEFKGSIAQLAKKHVHMGVKREYFPIVVKAIINSVEDQYGKGFTSAHKKAWYKILNQVSAIMIEEMEAYQRTLRNTSA
jgi:nitric oxide dioxygenase